MMPKGTNKQWAGANGDWIAMVGEQRWELFNVYTRRQIVLLGVFETTSELDRYNDDGHAQMLQKIVICQFPTSTGGYGDFSVLAIFVNAIASLYDNDDGWKVFRPDYFRYYWYSDAIVQNGLVVASTDDGCVHVCDPRHSGNHPPIYFIILASLFLAGILF